MATIGLTTVTTRIGTTTQFASYGTETSADDYYCPQVFNAFGYSSASRSESVIDQTLSGSNNGTSRAGQLTDELQNNKRPCMVGGYTDKYSGLGVGILPVPKGDAHEWVCDGSEVILNENGVANTYEYGVQTFTDTVNVVWTSLNYLHMNWGWGGI